MLPSTKRLKDMQKARSYKRKGNKRTSLQGKLGRESRKKKQSSENSVASKGGP